MAVTRAYTTEDGRNPYWKWFSGFNAAAAIKVTTALERMEEDGNFSNTKAVGSGVSEYKINFGPGYRIYFGTDGGDGCNPALRRHKEGQSYDIKAAQHLWVDYTARKKAQAKKEREK